MSRSTSIPFLAAAVLLIVSLACALPATPTTDPGTVNTAIAQTIVVGLTQTAMAVVPISMEDTPTSTPTPELPTVTPTATVSPTPVFTSTPVVPMVSVSVATNCRVGPGKVYDRVGALLVGEVAEVVGRNPTGNYWYIRNPDRTNGFCWLWGEYATVSGNLSVLPVYTPPPTPTPVPNFEPHYAGKDTCVGWWVELELENTGGIAFKSVSLTVRDTVTDVVVSMYADTFTNNDGCLNTVTRDNLPPGGSRLVSSPAFSYDPTGHKLRATVTLCSLPGQNGTCVTQVIAFTP